MVSKFRRTQDPLTAEDIQAVEKDLAFRLPDEVKRHYLQYNGGIPERPCWKLDWGDEYRRVSVFLPMKYSSSGGRTMENVYRKGIVGEYLTQGLVPFADDEGGNYFCFNEHGEIFFYAMDAWDKSLSDEENKRKAIDPVTHSFAAFVDGLVQCPDE